MTEIRPGPVSAAAKAYAGDGGFLLLDKPEGLSSFQALRPVKRLFPKAKVGHAGTLDPAASGLLLAGVGGGTRLLEYLEGQAKTYAFTAVFGFTSDSYDLEGAVLPFPASADATAPDATRIEAALAPFRGRIRQTPPAYSAIKVGGERAYALARAGETVVLESREVEVHSLELKSFTPAVPGSGTGLEGAARADFVMTCSKGTYVRSIVHDLGGALGCGAVTGKIRRLAIGPFRVESATDPAALTPETSLLPLEAAVAHLRAVTVPPEYLGRFLNGQTIPVAVPTSVPARMAADPDAASSATVDSSHMEARAHDAEGRLLAIASLSADGRLSPRKVLAKATVAAATAPAQVTPDERALP